MMPASGKAPVWRTVAQSAAPVLADCCGRRQAADMVYPTAQLTPSVQAIVKKRLGFLPAHLCDGHAALFHREGLVRAAQMPGSA